MRKKQIEGIDLAIIRFIRKISMPFARFAIFLVFFWFGILKVIGTSPAGPLVQTLMETTFLHTLSPEMFIILFGWFEMLLGILFLIPRLERVVFPLLLFHLGTTLMPLVMLPGETWQGFLTPTLVGQYIIKNVLLVALELLVIAHLHPMTKTHKFFSN